MSVISQVGLESEVCKYLLYSGQMSPEDIEEEETYAELWVGAHSKTPNYLATTGQDLAEFLRDHQHILGPRIVEKFGPNLPFLLKVLSIGHPLQLQVHPSKVTPCTFRFCLTLVNPGEGEGPAPEKPWSFPGREPQTRDGGGSHSVLRPGRVPRSRANPSIRWEDWGGVWGAGPGHPAAAEVGGDGREEVGRLLPGHLQVSSHQGLPPSTETTAGEGGLGAVLGRGGVQDSVWEFPRWDHSPDDSGSPSSGVSGDPGCFAPFLLNIYRLQPGEAIFLPAGEIHAYISGDCLEVLSCGDNVLFCGLVHQRDVSHFPPELTDPEILADIVNFSPRSGARVREQLDGENNLCLAPPVEEFRLTKIEVMVWGCKFDW